MDKITALVTLSEKCFANRLIMKNFSVIPLPILSDNIIYFRSSFNVLFILFICMFFAQVTNTTISLTWRIIRTTRLLNSITNVVFLIFKWWRCFFLLCFLHQVYYPLLPFYSGFLVLEYVIFLWLKCPNFSFFYSCEEYVVYMEIHLIHLIHV